MPDIRALMAEQQAEQQAVNTIGQGVAIVVSTAVKAGGEQAVKDAQAAAQALKDAQAAAQANPNETTTANVAAAAQALTDANNEVKHWGPDGRYTIATQVVSTIVMGLVSDQDPKAIAAMVSAPLIAQAIGDQVKSNDPIIKFLAHGVAAGLIAALGGADNKEALAAGLTESVIAPAIVKALYGDQYDVNNPEQRETILALSGVSGAIIAGIAGDSTDAAAYGAAGSLNAVANNFLNHDDAAALAKAFNEVCKGDAACEAEAINKAQKAYDRNEAALDLAILHGDLAEYERLLATAAPASAIPNTGIRMFADRADSLAQGINNQTNERTISQIATLRGQMCGGMEPLACDVKINELRVQGDQRALTLMSLLSGAGLGRVAGGKLLTRFTTVPAKSVASAAIGSGGFSTLVYLGVNGKSSTPAGIVSSFGIGAGTGAMGYGMNVAAGLSATTIPTTVGGAVIKANTAGIGTALGPVRNTTTSTGNSWWTSPLFKK